MRKIAAWGFTFVLSVIIISSLSFAGILPDLHSDSVEKIISVHAMTGRQSAPDPVMQDNGSYLFEYSNVSLMVYEDFGKALAQEGFQLETSEITDSGLVNASITDGEVSLIIDYNPYTENISVVYPEGSIVSQYEPENPYIVDRTRESILPEIPHAISFDSTTGEEHYESERHDDGRETYNYYGVSYDCYTVLSKKLEEAGFSLESNKMLIDGTSQAVVTDGQTTLEIEYNPDTEQASVTYPAGVFPKPAYRYEDYIILRDGDELSLMEDVNVKMIGWEEVDSYTDHLLDNNWIPAKYSSESHVSGYGLHQIYVTFLVDYNRPDEKYVNKLFYNMDARYAIYNPISFNKGEETGERDIYDDEDNTATGPDQFIFAVGLELSDSQMQNLDNVAITFELLDHTARYVYFLETPQ